VQRSLCAPAPLTTCLASSRLNSDTWPEAAATKKSLFGAFSELA
jgi:hypothetical protein